MEAGDMDESERADDDVHRVVRQRQSLQFSDVELAIWNPPTGMGEHGGGAVDADDLMPASGEELGETAGPACGVQRHTGFPALEVLGHDRLVDSEQPAARVLVIAGGMLLVGSDGADTLGEYATLPQ